MMSTIIKSCPAFRKKYNNCSKINNFAVGCKKRKVRLYILKNMTNNFDNYFLVNSVNNNNRERNKKWTQIIKINYLNIEVKLDTGAKVSIIAHSFYTKLLPKPLINKYQIKIRHLEDLT